MGSQNASPPRKSHRFHVSRSAVAVEAALTALETAVPEEGSFVPEAEHIPPHIEYANDEDEFRDAVTLRFHSVASYLFHWNGTVTQYSWPKVIMYAIYAAVVCIISLANCPDEPADPQTAPHRCRIGYGYTKFVGEAIVVWFAFSAFLFQSFVNAGLKRFEKTLTLVRRVQGRYHEMGLLLHSHALPPAGHTLVVIRRYLLAMVYLLFDDPVYGPRGEFLPLVEKILEPDEYEKIRNIKKPSDRAHVVMTWILSLCELAINVDCSGDEEEPLFHDTNGTLELQIARCLEALRGTVGSLTDSLDDAILPFPFAHLIICNIYLEFVVLPWASIGYLGYYLILVACIYFWFLDGMITFVFLVDAPFVDKVGGRTVEPLIDIHKIIAEIASALPRRYPTAYASKPRSSLETIRSPNDRGKQSKTE